VSEVSDLIAEAKEHLAAAEKRIEDLAHADATQLRIATHRLAMFLEHHPAAQMEEPVEEPVEPVEEAEPVGAEEPVEEPKARARKAKAEEPAEAEE